MSDRSSAKLLRKTDETLPKFVDPLNNSRREPCLGFQFSFRNLIEHRTGGGGEREAEREREGGG